MLERFSDAELAERVRDGDDAEAFRALCLRWRPRLLAYFGPLFGRADLAEDAAQEVLLRLWLRRRSYLAVGRFEAYLFCLARHQWLNDRRREARTGAAEPPPPAPDPAAAALAAAAAGVVSAAAAALPAGQREVWQLTAAGLAQAAVADRLGVPLGTVKSRLHHARRRILAALEESDE